MKKLFLKIYENKENMNVFFVERIENILIILGSEYLELQENKNQLAMIIEPVLMTEEEFLNLKEFYGF